MTARQSEILQIVRQRGTCTIMELATELAVSSETIRRSVKPLVAEIAMYAVWSALIVVFVMIMNAYFKPRTTIPRGIPVPVLILIVVIIAMTLVSRVTRFGRYVFGAHLFLVPENCLK